MGSNPMKNKEIATPAKKNGGFAMTIDLLGNTPMGAEQ